MEGSYLPILMLCAMLAFLLCGGGWVFAWKHLRRRIDERFDVLSEHLERHAAECPIRKEFLLASCLPNDPERKGNEAFHRSFRASYPGFLPTLRERVPGITPAEETLCMLIKMNLSNREIADKIYLHRKLAYHPLPAEAEDAAGGRQGHGRMGTGDRIGSWGGELPTLLYRVTPLSKKKSLCEQNLCF